MNLDSILIKEYEREKIHFQSIKDGVIQETEKTFSLKDATRSCIHKQNKT